MRIREKRAKFKAETTFKQYLVAGGEVAADLVKGERPFNSRKKAQKSQR
jgi:hypothetical protein